MDDESIEKWAKALISAVVEPKTVSEYLQYQQILEKVKQLQELGQGQVRR